MRPFLLVLCLAISAFAADPITFRGAYIGEPLSDFVDCSSHKPRVLKDGFKIHGKVCEGGRGTVSHVKAHFGSPALEGETFGFEDAKLSQITINIPDEDWESIKHDLTEPSEVFQNGFGAKWEYDHGCWEKADIAACAGIKVATSAGGSAIMDPFTNRPMTRGIEITIIGKGGASKKPNSLD